MASTTSVRTKTVDGPRHPMRGTHSSAANQLFPKGTIVTRNASGEAVSPSTADASGFPALGIAAETLDNRTGSELGGAAGACDPDVEYGVKGVAYTGTAPKTGDVVYVVDNQTVSRSSAGGTRGVAGVCSETRDGQCFVLFSPELAASLTVSMLGMVPIALTSFVDADGDPLAKFVDAASPTFGFALANSEALCLRWNNDASPGTARSQVGLPPDLDDAEDITLEFLCSKSGATDADDTALTIAAFLISAGDLHDADADAGGATNALVGTATAKTTAVLSRTIAAADVPAGARSMSFSVTPTLLATDDLLIHEIRLRYQKKP